MGFLVRTTSLSGMVRWPTFAFLRVKRLFKPSKKLVLFDGLTLKTEFTISSDDLTKGTILFFRVNSDNIYEVLLLGFLLFGLGMLYILYS
jgi:hypothetical protein